MNKSAFSSIYIYLYVLGTWYISVTQNFSSCVGMCAVAYSFNACTHFRAGEQRKNRTKNVRSAILQIENEKMTRCKRSTDALLLLLLLRVRGRCIYVSLTRSTIRIRHCPLVGISLLVLLIQANSMGSRRGNRRIGPMSVWPNSFDDGRSFDILFMPKRNWGKREK